MRKLTLTFLAGAGALIASSAYAADETQIGDSSPLLHQARLVCNDAGQCWNTRGDRRVIIGNGYYGPRRYYDRDYYRALARSLAAGKGYVASDETGRELPHVGQTPVYPLFLAGLMKVGGPHVRCPLPSKVPLFTATVFGGEVRLKPRPA